MRWQGRPSTLEGIASQCLAVRKCCPADPRPLVWRSMRASARLTLGAASVAAGMLFTWAALRVMPMPAPLEQVAFAPAPAQSPVDGPTLWVLAVGVSRYQDPRLNLAFAERDARAVAKVLRDQEKGQLYSAIRTRVL